jgi:uncharacterized protein YbjT (DUF2867 family)
VDLPSLRAAVTTAARDGVQHFIFLSVAQPAPVMRAYIQVRAECERIICDMGLHATVVRPWYVLGPGHWWPAFLKPVYWLAARIETSREDTQRLRFVRLDQMIRTLVWAVEHPERLTTGTSATAGSAANGYRTRATAARCARNGGRRRCVSWWPWQSGSRPSGHMACN